MKVRKATEADRPFIEKLYRQHKQELGSFNLFWAWDDYLAGKRKSTFVLIEGEGFMRYGYSKRYTAYVLHEIGVDNDSQRKGVGKVLFDHLPRPLLLKCNCDNERGNAFYEKMGMTKVGLSKTKKGVEQNLWWIT